MKEWMDEHLKEAIKLSREENLQTKLSRKGGRNGSKRHPNREHRVKDKYTKTTAGDDETQDTEK